MMGLLSGGVAFKGLGLGLGLGFMVRFQGQT